MKKSVSITLIVLLVLSVGVLMAASNEVTGKFTSFKFIVNGEEQTLDASPIVVNGQSYLPVRAVSDMLGYNVNYDGNTKTITLNSKVQENNIPKEEPTTNDDDTGFTRSQPALLGTTLIFDYEDVLDSYTASMTLKELVRGEKAWEMIQGENPFNSPAEEGHEYILARFHIKLIDNKDEESQISFSSFLYTLVSSQGKDYDFVTVIVPNPSIHANLYEGADHEGWVAFKVKKDDTNPLISFGRSYDGKGGIWFNTK